MDEHGGPTEDDNDDSEDTPARAAPPEGKRLQHRLESTAIAFWIAALLVLGVGLWIKGEQERQDHRRSAELSIALAQVEDPDLDAWMDPSRIPPLTADDIEERLPLTTGTIVSGLPTTTTSTPGNVLERGNLGTARYELAWSSDPNGADVWLIVRERGADEPAVTILRSDSLAGKVEAQQVVVDDSAFLIGAVPARTASVTYQADGEEPIDVPLIDLSERGADERSPKLIGLALPGAADQATITAVGTDGRETTTPVR